MTRCTDPNCSWLKLGPDYNKPHDHLALPDPEGDTRLDIIRRRLNGEEG